MKLSIRGRPKPRMAMYLERITEIIYNDKAPP